MMSRIPPVSPASIMLVVRSSKTTGYCRMALASVAPPSTVVRTPVSVFWKDGFSWLAARIFQTLHQRQAGIDHDRELAEENRDVLDLDLARTKRGHGEFLALFADRTRYDALAAQRLLQRLFVGRHPLAIYFLSGSVLAGKCKDWHGLVSPHCLAGCQLLCFDFVLIPHTYCLSALTERRRGPSCFRPLSHDSTGWRHD